jgi:uncharacterized protein
MSERTRYRERYTGWALVTGATAGIGSAIAEQLAAGGMDLVLVARSAPRLEERARELRDRYRIKVEVHRADLSTRTGVDALIEGLGDREVGVLVPCAAAEERGYLIDGDLAAHQRLLDMNCYGPMRLAHHFGHGMAQRRNGAILFVSSLSGWSAQPYMAHYGAAKAYVLSLGEALHQEMKDKGVDVSVLSPGPTDTSMAPDVNAELAKMGMAVMSPDDVARAGLSALGRRPNAVPGVRNKFMMTMMTRLMPRAWAGAMFRWSMRRVMLRIERSTAGAQPASGVQR